MDSGHRVLVCIHPSSTALSLSRVAGGLELLPAALGQQRIRDNSPARGWANIQRQTAIYAHIRTEKVNSESPLHLALNACLSSGGRCLERTHTDLEKTYIIPHTKKNKALRSVSKIKMIIYFPSSYNYDETVSTIKVCWWWWLLATHFPIFNSKRFILTPARNVEDNGAFCWRQKSRHGQLNSSYLHS